MASDLKALTKKHPNLTHSDFQKVSSHVQREEDDWIVNTIMIEGYDVPFTYKRKQEYQSLKGARVNLTYYPAIKKVAGLDFEYMNVVRIKKS